MADYIKRIRTEAGDLQIDYESLANLPVSDTTLTQSGKFADAKAVGDRLGSMSSPVTSVNSKTGAVMLSASDVDAVPVTRTVNSKALSANITLSASDVNAVPTTRKVNNKALSADITLSASDVSAVPTTRTVNSKALSSDITLSASDVGAAASSHTHSDYVTKTSFSLSGTNLTITIS